MAVGLMPPAAPPPRPARRLAWWAVVLAVLAVHAGVTRTLVAGLADLRAEAAMPPRMQVAYVRELLPAPPPAVPPAPAAPKLAQSVAAVRPAASAPRDPAQPVEPADPEDGAGVGDSLVMQAPPPTPPDPAVTPSPGSPGTAHTALAPAPAGSAAAALEGAAAGSAPAVTAAAASSAAADAAAPAFTWPASTRISYLLNGNYRGPVSGNAQVEWIRIGSRYQVHVELVVGPPALPLVTRRMSSDGEIAETGLAPQRYDEETRVALQDPRRVTLTFQAGSVLLANGERAVAAPGVQDTASQFVQLTYVFSTRPELLRVGNSIEMPLALARRVDVWTYDVLEEETLDTPFGPLAALHLKPRAAVRPGALSVEMWIAPQLRYLPVRIRFTQDPQTYADLMIARPPEIAAP